jgi:predicted PurR-regulated permease PerM
MSGGAALEFLRAQHEKRFRLTVTDPQPVESGRFWVHAGQAAAIGVFLILGVAATYFARSLLLPIFAAVLIGTTLTPLARAAAKRGIPTWISAIVIGLCILGAAAVAITLLSNPVTEWINRAPEIGVKIKEKLYFLNGPLAGVRELQNILSPPAANEVTVTTGAGVVVEPILAVVTPALTQIALFFGTLIFFLIGQAHFRKYLVSLFTDRDAKLRALKIVNDVESNLATYIAVVTAINFILGAFVAGVSWLFGLPNPVILGAVAMILNYLPYIGPATMMVILFAVGLMTFPNLGQALPAPLSLAAFAAIEGNFITPTILGHALTLNPLTVFLALAFWAWLWGPLGAFLAVPLSIVGLVIFNHLFAADETKLPE